MVSMIGKIKNSPGPFSDLKWPRRRIMALSQGSAIWIAEERASAIIKEATLMNTLAVLSTGLYTAYGAANPIPNRIPNMVPPNKLLLFMIALFHHLHTKGDRQLIARSQGPKHISRRLDLVIGHF